jgi:hypothetical protein
VFGESTRGRDLAGAAPAGASRSKA